MTVRTVVVSIQQLWERNRIYKISPHVSISNIMRQQQEQQESLPWNHWLFSCMERDDRELKIVFSYSEFVHSITMAKPEHDYDTSRRINICVYAPLHFPRTITASTMYDITYTKSLLLSSHVQTLVFQLTYVHVPPKHATNYENDQSWYDQQTQLFEFDSDNNGPL